MYACGLLYTKMADSSALDYLYGGLSVPSHKKYNQKIS